MCPKILVNVLEKKSQKLSLNATRSTKKKLLVLHIRMLATSQEEFPNIGGVKDHSISLKSCKSLARRIDQTLKASQVDVSLCNNVNVLCRVRGHNLDRGEEGRDSREHRELEMKE